MGGYRRELVDGHVTISRRSKILVTDPDKLMPLLQLIARGMSNRLIANSLTLSEGQVRERLRDLFGVLGAVDRAHAVAIGYDNGLLTRDPDREILPADIAEKFGELTMVRKQTQESLALGAALSAVMIEAGLTQAALARLLNRDVSFVNRTIYGKVGGSTSHVAAWLDACNVTGSKHQEILAMALPCHLCGCRLQHVDSDNGAATNE
jgi:DNA-binding CsgD family transcriptional regulator